jgi:hypothetical protein
MIVVVFGRLWEADRDLRWINLPGVDKYGTQLAISFVRQLREHGCF